MQTGSTVSCSHLPPDPAKNYQVITLFEFRNYSLYRQHNTDIQKETLLKHPVKGLSAEEAAKEERTLFSPTIQHRYNLRSRTSRTTTSKKETQLTSSNCLNLADSNDLVSSNDSSLYAVRSDEATADVAEQCENELPPHSSNTTENDSMPPESYDIDLSDLYTEEAIES